jgi:hypothetical protein
VAPARRRRPLLGALFLCYSCFYAHALIVEVAQLPPERGGVVFAGDLHLSVLMRLETVCASGLRRSGSDDLCRLRINDNGCGPGTCAAGLRSKNNIGARETRAIKNPCIMLVKEVLRPSNRH